MRAMGVKITNWSEATPEGIGPCIYRHSPLGRNTWRRGNVQSIYGCSLHNQCTLLPNHHNLYNCQDCKDRLLPDAPELAQKFIDPLVISTPTGQRTDALRNRLAGVPTFLVCGGASARDLDLAELRRPGIWSLGVNNAAAAAHTDAFVCADPPAKFSHSIWMDPKMMKFVPEAKLRSNRGGLRRKTLAGFEALKQKVAGCPNVWAFQRRSWIRLDDSFFTEPSAAWGAHRKGAEQTGLERVVCTMLLGLRLLYYLGSRRIYLVGVDFWMSQDKGYFFPQSRSEDACRSNNYHFNVVNRWLCQMESEGVFRKFGLEIYNCNRLSRLRAFPYVPFDYAIADAKGIVEDEPDTEGYYEPEPKK